MLPRARPVWWPIALATTAVILGIGLAFLSAHQKIGAISSLVLVLLAAGVFVYTLGARVGVLALMVVTTMLDRFTLSAGAVDVRVEQFAALLGLAIVGYTALVQRDGANLLRPSRVEVLLGLWFVVSLISSIAFAPSVGRSVKGVGLLLISSLGLLLPRRLISPAAAEDEMSVVVRVLLVGFAAEAAYGTATWLLHVLGPTISISANGATGHLNAYGTLWEPNVFGAACAAGAVAWTWLGPRHFRHAWIGIALCLAGDAVSFTRAAWLAAVLVLALGVFGPLRLRATQRQFALGLMGAAAITIVAVAAEHTGDYYLPVQGAPGAPPPRGIFAILQNEVDVLGRVDQIRLAGPEITTHLVLGNGTASYGVRHLDKGAPEHIANLELAVLYDTGIVGLLIFVAFMVAVAWEAWKHRRNPFVAGLGMTVLVIAITNTATETTELMISWLLAGLLLMAVDVARAGEQTQQSSARAA